MPRAAMFTMAENWTLCRCLATVEYINKVWYIPVTTEAPRWAGMTCSRRQCATGPGASHLQVASQLCSLLPLPCTVTEEQGAGNISFVPAGTQGLIGRDPGWTLQGEKACLPGSGAFILPSATKRPADIFPGVSAVPQQLVPCLPAQLAAPQ